MDDEERLYGDGFEGDYYYPKPEDFEPEPERPPGPLSRFPSLKDARPAILCFVLFYIASVLYSRYPVGNQLWASGESVLHRYEYWRLVTSLFTHADLFHLLSNTLLFLIFGWLLRAYFGFLVFPVTSILIGVASTLITISIYEPQIRLIGASGMLYGMAALWLIFYIRYDVDHPVPIRIFRAVGFIMLILLPTTFNPETSYLAHAVGFGIGIATGILLLPVVEVREINKKGETR